MTATCFGQPCGHRGSMTVLVYNCYFITLDWYWYFHNYILYFFSMCYSLNFTILKMPTWPPETYRKSLCIYTNFNVLVYIGWYHFCRYSGFFAVNCKETSKSVRFGG